MDSGAASGNFNLKKRKLPSESSAEETLRIARGIFPHVQTLRFYVEELNSSISSHGVQVSLDAGNDGSDPAYSHIVNSLLIAGTSKPTVPDSVVEGLRGHRVQPDDIVQQVIQTALRSNPDIRDHQRVNILTLGFSPSRPSGNSSRFRSLDSRGPSSVIETLLSPPWRRLFSQLGHVVMRYLLSSTTLLLPLQSPSKRVRHLREANPNPELYSSFNSSILQLCGEIPRPLDISLNKNSHKECIIDYRKSVLHRTARDKYLPLKNVPGAIGNGTENQQSAEALPRAELQKRSLLNAGLPSMHFLQHLGANRRSALSLYRLIFGESATASDNSATGMASSRASRSNIAKRSAKREVSGVCPLPMRLRPVLPILQKFIQRTKAKSFRDILGLSCPLPAWVRLAKGTSVDVHQLTKSTTNPRLVARFLVACVRQSFPDQLLGSVSNMQILEQGIHTFVRKRTRNESFNAAAFFATSGFKVTEVPWLFCKGPNGNRIKNPTDLCFRQKKFAKFLSWVFQGFIVPILLKSFYVTESAVFGQRILYYRKEIWAKLLSCSMKETLHRDRRLFEPISTDALISGIHRRDHALVNLKIGLTPCQFITCFQLRFVPKTSGTRPIQRLQAKPWGKIAKRLPGTCGIQAGFADPALLRRNLERARRGTKSFFSIAQKILRVCCKQRPELLGSSVFCLDDIYSKLVHFKKRWVMTGRKQIFAVALDIAKSFDSIPLKILAETVAPEVLGPVRYVAIRYAVVTRNEATGRITRRFESHICQRPGEETSFKALITNKLYQRHARAIFIDLVRVQILHRRDVLELVQEFLLNNIVILPRFNRRPGGTPYARQIQGVGQGNPASPVLASLFYGHIERRHLREYMQENTPSGPNNRDGHALLFMRQIDDTFFASTDKEITSQFTRKMTEGWDEVSGFNVNAAKTRSNYITNFGGRQSMRIIPWCGLLVDTQTLEIRCDFTRYVHPRLSRLRESLSIDFEAHCGQGLIGKAWTCFRPKIHPVLMDGNINSRRSVALNVYQASLLLALKICAHALAIEVQNGNFLLSIVQNAICRVSELVRRSSASAIGRKYNCKQPLSGREVQFLVVYAFTWAFSERFCVYRGGKVTGKLVTAVLTTSMQNIEGEVTSCIPAAANMLVSVTQCYSNEVLWKIKL